MKIDNITYRISLESLRRPIRAAERIEVQASIAPKRFPVASDL